MKTCTVFVILIAVLATSSNAFKIWDPFNLFGGSSATTTTTTTTIPSNALITVTTTVAPTPKKPSILNPFGLITGVFDAIGSTVSSVGGALVNLVTGGGATTTTTTPFPYPKVAAFFSDPGAALSGHSDEIPINPAIVACLIKLIRMYAEVLARIDTFLPSCLSSLKFRAVFILPKVLGLLPVLDLLKIPSKTLKKCPYANGCMLMMVRDTINEMNKSIAGISKTMIKLLPDASSMGKTTIGCLTSNYAKLLKDIPAMINLTCLRT